MQKAAQRVLGSSCGINLNSWFVANHPVGHHVEQPRSDNSSKTTEDKQGAEEESAVDSTKIFFMKARVFAGQADIRNNSYELEDFKWLSKDEVEKHVTPEYWQSVKNMLVQQ